MATKRKPSAKGKGSRLSWLNSSKARLWMTVLVFGLVGAGYFLYQSFALTNQVKYWGVLTKDAPAASYKLTSGKGKMNVAFSNNTADVTLTVTNSAKQIVGSLKSVGKRDVTLAIDVAPGTYTFDLKATKAFSGNKGYKVAIAYPSGELTPATKPTAAITKPLATETVSGIVDFNADAKDAKGISKVEFYADNVLIGTDNELPYSVKWDTTKLTAGAHQLAVKAFNATGMFGEAAGSTTVKKVVVPPTVPTVTNERFGMSAPADVWDTRLSDVGGKTHIKYRRIFLTGFDANLKLVQRAIDDGMVPILSYKVGPYSWAQVASGSADADIKALVKRLDAIPGEKFVALHHEPAKDGTAKDWSNMQIHALPIFKTGQNIKVGVIGNGWWWSNQANGYTDAEIAEWIPAKVIEISDVIAADTYQDEKLKESGGPKIHNMASWAKRVGGVKAMGIGEFNGLNPAGITEAMNAIKTEPIFKWACVWNSHNDGGAVGFPLEGARLDAFKKGLATPNQT